MQKKSIELKSNNFTLLVLYLNNQNIDLINQSLYKKIQECPKFFKNAPIIVNVSKLCNTVDWKKIKKIIISHGFFVVGVSGCQDGILKKNIIDSGLPILSERKNNKSNIITNFFINSYKNKKKETINKVEKTHIIDIPVRSGQKIYAKHADLIVINNVSAGAELVADGNIHVYGIVRGRVLAGANGDTSRKIFCTGLFAELVSISGEYWLSDQIPSEFIGKSAQIYLKNKFLTINSLS
ncbi:septum site-determining protein MinC [Buchnera aphidicola str. APS (Acyrthosiphon pisum)]|uniref:Probable septum site-determining protein MinC n=3 Tax=Buchnera aphidicola TaxID=9 RepID=MINC_BUCAI|nr:septum site-determining protein MinC [Buchnera aphidicola]B8D7L9.1 RecName: Full=Probable septum site-determining protein MinC [Buchnera aphidicola str. Tuc7 (Acyrthosiphon pisum)]B8D9B7.1 RecName: Full=Probable septum site-determining protein MinC [Buchnera aphidicola str. 5A (Acyrthosiphon pisum)]P57412.1 RecName: Full=Probable septum site-determining protein MinC [Buchnera aphidicola str. APS (Acyrthosiphon pisum)]pir/C84968/ cell division inhibitor minC [imported] - Buchnera sp. (strain 